MISIRDYNERIAYVDATSTTSMVIYLIRTSFSKSRCRCGRQKALTRLDILTMRQTDAHLDVAFVCKSHGQIAHTQPHNLLDACVRISTQGCAYLLLPDYRILVLSAEYQRFACVVTVLLRLVLDQTSSVMIDIVITNAENLFINNLQVIMTRYEVL
ncbi:unnamed protein product [Danaus chrysippus]|uniref:(African queen) hypothetical protein n=1 Tax=Danaus chrysippus TaxID=151541 RepID=A0A8J2QPL5_9NEOP|nr:unnamed protein product [Danaus chrysippus]